MSASARPPRSTLPAFPLQPRSQSPDNAHPSHHNSINRRSLSPKGLRLPPIQSLDFPQRPPARERNSSQPLGSSQHDQYPHPSDSQFASRNLKRAAASVGSEHGQGPYKKRRTDDLADSPQQILSQNPSTNNSLVTAPTPGPESHAAHLAKKGNKSLTPLDHTSLVPQHSNPSNPPDTRPQLVSRHSSSSSRSQPHSREPSWHQQGPPPPPQQAPVHAKLEQLSPPASLPSSSTPVAAPPWQSEASTSFSRRLSQSTTGQRSTPRKQPPSRLTLQPRDSLHPASRSLQPAIQSAPPIPVHGTVPGATRAHGPWMAERPRNNVHPGGGNPSSSIVGVSTASASASVTTTNSILNAEAVPAPAIRSTARHGATAGAYPALPTPTSLRLGALQQQQQQQQLHPPLHSNANPNAAFPNSPSPYGYRGGPVTPAVPSPLPVLGSGAGVSDKAKFMSKMSEIYDRATSHRNCISIEEVDRRIREATAGLQQEVVGLRKEVDILRRQAGRRRDSAMEISGDEDGDVNMEPPQPIAAPAEGSLTSKAPMLPELPRIEPPTPQSADQPSMAEGLAATMNGRVGEKGKEKEKGSPKDDELEKGTPPK